MTDKLYQQTLIFLSKLKGETQLNTYKVRCETMMDGIRFVKLIAASCLRAAIVIGKDPDNIQLSFNIDNFDCFGGCELTFVSYLELEVLREVIKIVPDAHVMYSTLNHIANYTPKRNREIEKKY